MSAAASDPTIRAPIGPADSESAGVTVSLSEIDATCRKAARGAAYEWGLAEEAGQAARSLACWGLPGPEELLAALDAVAERPRRSAPVPDGESTVLDDRSADTWQWRAAEGFLCPIATGAALSDHAGWLLRGHSVTLVEARHPLLLLPFLYRAACDLAGRFRLTAAGLVITVDASGVDGDSERMPRTVDHLHVAGVGSLHPRRRATMRDTTHCRVSADVWRALERYAMRTCVPSSDASRSGAGAGVTDND